MNEPQPYLHFDEHRRDYDHFHGTAPGQEFIRDSHDDRYKWHYHDQYCYCAVPVIVTAPLPY